MTAFDPSYVLLYVQDPQASAAAYQRLLGQAPVELSPTFALFVLPSGRKLGLWQQPGVLPVAEGQGARGELCSTVADMAALEAAQTAGVAAGWTLILPITEMDFGTTLVLADADGHRLRYFVPAQA